MTDWMQDRIKAEPDVNYDIGPPSAQDKIAAIIGKHTDHPASHDDLIAAQILAALPDILPGMIPPLIWQRNGSHWAGGHGYVIRKLGSQYTLTIRNQFDQQFDTLEAAQEKANSERVIAVMTAFIRESS